jgi:hypothetical protein
MRFSLASAQDRVLVGLGRGTIDRLIALEKDVCRAAVGQVGPNANGLAAGLRQTRAPKPVSRVINQGPDSNGQLRHQ